MALGSWVIAAVVRFSTTGVGALRSAGLEVNRLNSQLDGHSSKVARLTNQYEQMRTKMLQVGAVATGSMALAGAGFSAYGIYGAAQLERALTSVGIATNANSQGAMQRYAALAFKTSGITAQDVNTIAGEMAMAATSGLNDPRKLEDAFTRIAKAADVLWMSPKHIDPVDAVKSMSQLSHMFGIYSGKPLQHMLDRAAEMMFVQPEALSNLVTQGRMFISSGVGHGVSEDDIFKQAMTMGQTSFLRGRGGAGLANVIEYLGGASTITGHLSKVQHGAMATLGLTGRNGLLQGQYLGPHGELLLGKVVDHLEAIRKNFGLSDFGNLLTNAFLKQGGRYMETALNPKVYAKSQQNWQMMQAIGTVDDMWKRYSHNFIYQWSVFWTNLVNIPKAIFFPLLPQLTDLFQSWGKQLGTIVEYLSKNPDAAKRWGEGILAFTGVMGAAWLAFTVRLGWSAITMPIAMGRLQAAIDRLTVSVATDGTIIGSSGKTAAAGLGAVAGALSLLAVTASFWVGIAKNMGDAAHNPKLAKLIHWANSGANSGVTPPGTEGTVDVFGRPLPGSGIKLPSQRQPQRRVAPHGGGHPITVGSVTISFPNVKDGEGAKAAMIEFWSNPMTALFASSSQRTHANIPLPLTVLPA